MNRSDIAQVRTVEQLCHLVARGARPNYLLFWGHRPAKDGSVTQSCLSQWWPSKFELDSISYPSAEHFMMAEKARLFGDDGALQKVLQATSPAKAKAIGRQVVGYDEASWRAARFDAVVKGNQAKFTQSPALRDYLVKTGRKVLVEASPVDAIWGIGLGANDPSATNPAQWRGLNLLGFALMAVRAGLPESN